MKFIFSVLVLLTFSGCLTLLTDSREYYIRKYETKNSDVSPKVMTAIRDERILKGMSMKEVELAWGKPGKRKVIPSGEGKRETVW